MRHKPSRDLGSALMDRLDPGRQAVRVEDQGVLMQEIAAHLDLASARIGSPASRFGNGWLGLIGNNGVLRCARFSAERERNVCKEWGHHFAAVCNRREFARPVR